MFGRCDLDIDMSDIASYIFSLKKLAGISRSRADARRAIWLSASPANTRLVLLNQLKKGLKIVFTVAACSFNLAITTNFIIVVGMNIKQSGYRWVRSLTNVDAPCFIFLSLDGMGMPSTPEPPRHR